MKATVEIIKITPKMAREFLACRLDGQRNIRDSWVFNLITQITKGEFRLSCDAIVLVKGMLANGQHRLTAVAESGIACDFILMRTDDEDLYRLIDCGCKRTAADVLGGENSRDVASVTSKILEMKKGILTTMGRKFSDGKSLDYIITREELLSFAESNYKLITEAIQFVQPLRQSMNLLPTSIAASVYFVGCQKDKTKTDEFFVALFDGKATEESSATDLRNRIIKTKMSKVKIPSSYLCGLTIKALRSFINGTRPGVLKMVEGEEFPKFE